MRHHGNGKVKERSEVPGPIFRRTGAALVMPSSISCIRLCPKHSPHAVDGGPNGRHALYPFVVFCYPFVLLHYDHFVVMFVLVCADCISWMVEFIVCILV